LKKISLRIKLSLYSSLLVLGVVSSVGVSLYFAERHYLIQRVQQSQMEIVQFLAQIGREAVANKSDLLLSSYLALIRRSRALSYAMVVNEQGQIVAHSNVILVGQKPSDPVTLKGLESRSLLRQVAGSAADPQVDLSLPIYLEGRRIGTARVGYSQNSTKHLVDQTLQAARHRIALATAIALLLGILGAVLLAYYISRPIRHLRDGAREIGEGALDHRIEITSRDELGELAEEFNVMAAKLQELDQLKQDFVSNVTHELRSPLTSLRGYVELLLRGSAGPLTQEQTENLIVVKNNAVRLARFIDNLLDVAKIESKKIELHPERVSLSQMVQEMAVVFRPQSLEKNIQLVNEIPPDLPPLWADADKLSEIFTNLLSNAFKFTPENGRIAVTAKEEGDSIHILVKDTGIGIPASSLKTVFNKFEQVKPTVGLVRKTKGTGLGLTIVKGFVEAHGGKVWIESAGNGGTSVHFLLPKSRPEDDHFLYEDEEDGGTKPSPLQTS
jgi:signal transduction histidine kinase